MNDASQSGSRSQEVLRAFLGPEFKPFAGVNGNSSDAAGGSQSNGAAGGDGQSETGAASAIADVWQRGDKYAHGAMPAAVDEAAGAAAIAAGNVHLVPVKNHVRQAPGEKQKDPLTLDRLVRGVRARSAGNDGAARSALGNFPTRGFASKAKGRST